MHVRKAACQKGRMSERPHVKSISQVTFYNASLSSQVLTFIYLGALMINNFTRQNNKRGAFFTGIENDDTETCVCALLNNESNGHALPKLSHAP